MEIIQKTAYSAGGKSALTSLRALGIHADQTLAETKQPNRNNGAPFKYAYICVSAYAALLYIYRNI